MRSQSEKEEQEGKKKAAGSEMTARLQYWMEWRRAGGGVERKKNLELMKEDGWMVM